MKAETRHGQLSWVRHVIAPLKQPRPHVGGITRVVSEVWVHWDGVHPDLGLELILEESYQNPPNIMPSWL